MLALRKVRYGSWIWPFVCGEGDARGLMMREGCDVTVFFGEGSSRVGLIGVRQGD